MISDCDLYLVTWIDLLFLVLLTNFDICLFPFIISSPSIDNIAHSIYNSYRKNKEFPGINFKNKVLI